MHTYVYGIEELLNILMLICDININMFVNMFDNILLIHIIITPNMLDNMFEGNTYVSQNTQFVFSAKVLIRSNVSTKYVTGFERTRLPRTQQEDTLFTITR